MDEVLAEKRGLSQRMLQELLKSPKFKAGLRIMTNEIDPSTTRGLVRTLVWEDVETFMGTVSALPALINGSLSAAHELFVQLNSFPPPMLAAFISRLLEDLDFETMEQAVVEAGELLDKLQPVMDGLREASSGVRGRIEAFQASPPAE